MRFVKKWPVDVLDRSIDTANERFTAEEGAYEKLC